MRSFGRVSSALLVAGLASWWSAGCCEFRGKHDTYSFYWRFQTIASDIEWTSPTIASRSNPRFVMVVVPDDDITDPGELVEIFDADSGERMAIERSLHVNERADRRFGGACTVDYVEYDLRRLPVGVYTVVHRLSSQLPGRTTMPADEWTEFEGEQALVTTMFVSEPADLDDAGTVDAGP